MGIQPKLTLSEPDDKYEREAERVADAVMRMSDWETTANAQEEMGPERIQRMCSRCRMRYRQGKPLNCEECERKLQRKRDRDASQKKDKQVGLPVRSVQTGGRPLPDPTRSFFENRFGRDFSDVRVHTDSEANRVADSLNAKAFTVGRDIGFADGNYRPTTTEGKKLVAHELTHAIQQRKGESSTIQEPPTIQRQGGGSSSGGSTFSVSLEGCGKSPYSESVVENAARDAFEKVKNSGCVKTQGLKRDILGEFNGLTIKCKQGGSDCGEAYTADILTQGVTIYEPSLQSRCGPLKSTILHEVIHAAGYLHGSGTPTGCEKSCFGYGKGDATDCVGGKGNRVSASSGVSPGNGLPVVLLSYRRFIQGLANGHIQLTGGLDLNLTRAIEAGTDTDVSGEIGSAVMGVQARTSPLFKGEGAALTAEVEAGASLGQFRVRDAGSEESQLNLGPGYVIQAGIGAEFHIPSGVTSTPLSVEAMYRRVTPLNEEAEAIHGILGSVGLRF